MKSRIPDFPSGPPPYAFVCKICERETPTYCDHITFPVCDDCLKALRKLVQENQTDE